MIASGSAPIAADVLDFLKIAFGGDVLEGKPTILSIRLYANDICFLTRLRHDRELWYLPQRLRN